MDFDVLSRREIPEYRCRALHLRHRGTGCEVLHLGSEDTENLFAFCFTTPPGDDTGVSHITEHSVLSGSRRYPLKEPFSALMKGSMHTFLNAFTYPDRTVYPASSCNKKDFFNLMRVYGDAVFRPLLRKETFMQEAWRLEPRETSGTERRVEGSLGSYRYAGVVYNEMKGAYSSPESIVAEWALRSLFPDTPYHFDSGGDPRSIPTLTLDSLRGFHARFYHPSNCRIFLYGNIPVEESLEVLQSDFLHEFSASPVDSAIPRQPRWSEPRLLRKTFPVKEGTSEASRTTICMSWLLSPVTEPLMLVTLELLSEVMVGSAGSPLRKQLMDSGLGQDLSPVSGLETDVGELIFSVGLRGTERDREERVREIVLDTLSSLHSGGIDKGLVESMINRVEFRHREIRGNGSPYALRLMGRAFRGWIHGMDPVSSLEFAPVMRELKSLLARDDRHLEKSIAAHFLQNPHRVTLVVGPDREQERRDAEEENAALIRRETGLSAEQKHAVLQEAESFRSYQLTPDPPESRALIPSLGREDLPREVEKIPIVETATRSGIPVFSHDIFTNEILYVELCFPTDGIRGDGTLYLPLFGKAVCGSGLPGVSYSQVALDLYRLTGGFAATLDAGGIAGSPDVFGQYAFFRMKCLRQNFRTALDLVGRLLREADFLDLARLRELVLELRNSMKAALIPSGHQFAMLRAASKISDSAAREEEWRGVTQLLFLDELASRLDQALPEIASRLEGIRNDLLTRANLIANATATEDCFAEISEAVDALGSSLQRYSADSMLQRYSADSMLQRYSADSMLSPGRSEKTALKAPLDGDRRPRTSESLVTSATVGYVARAIRGFRYEEEGSGPVAVLGHLLSTGYLWEKVRMEGGAYGAFCHPSNLDGLFLFGSYRDPHVTRTLRAFRESLSFIGADAPEETEVTRAVIGAVGREERPLDPGEKGFVSLQRRLHGVTDELRQARRDRLVSVDRRSLAETAGMLLDRFDRGSTAVIANRKSLDNAAAEMAELAGAPVDLPE